MNKRLGPSAVRSRLERFPLVLSTWLVAACTGYAGDRPQTGAGGTKAVGGSGGTMATGSAGSSGTTGAAGTTGLGGTTGVGGDGAGTTGAGATAGTGPTGAAGAAGRGGSTGAAGAGGRGGSTGAGGAAGRGGSTGSGGGGTGGMAGTGMLPQDDPNLTFTDDDFQVVSAPEKMLGALGIDISADERAFVALRRGQIRIWKPDNSIVTAGQLSVFSGNEDGLLNLALDPGFMTNNYLYVYYSAPNENFQRLSRFTVNGDRIDMGSESIMLKVPDDRNGACCHTGGGMQFDWNGNLYLSTGDGTDPFASDGYSPIDQGRAVADASRSSGNTKDFRGKILRIKPTADGRYSIPTGNLFANAADGLPEIYVMGNRNPYRIAVDKARNWVYWGDVGPDSGAASSSRGPRGYDEFNQAKAPGNFGWPFCLADNKPYNAYDFGSMTSGAAFDCAGGPTNSSRNNTGMQKLPPAQPAWMFYSPDSGSNPLDTNDRGGRTALGGDVYNWKMGGAKTKLPRGLDGHVFLMEFARQWIRDVTVDSTGRYMSNKRFLQSVKSSWGPVIGMRISPSGVMYVITYGGIDTYAGSSMTPGDLYRVEYVGAAGKLPIPVISSDVDSGPAPLTVKFSSMGTRDPGNRPLTYEWDFNGDGMPDSTQADPQPYTYNTPGAYKAKLTVRNGLRDPVNNQLLAASAILDIGVGNARPVVTVQSPPAGGFVGANELVDYTISVTDAEDGSTTGSLPCTNVGGELQLAHDQHVHSGLVQFGCTGTVRTAPSIIPEENAWHQILATYEDAGGPGGAPALTGRALVPLNFKRIEAEHFPFRGSVNNATAAMTNDAMGGVQHLGSINDGSWVCWDQMNFQGINSLSYRVRPGTGGRIEVHQDSPTGDMLSTVNIPSGGMAWTNVTATLSPSSGTHKMCFVFRGSMGATNLFSLNWIDFVGAGVSHP
jgi:glucose/arabinose dehydrogenase